MAHVFCSHGQDLRHHSPRARIGLPKVQHLQSRQAMVARRIHPFIGRRDSRHATDIAHKIGQHQGRPPLVSCIELEGIAPQTTVDVTESQIRHRHHIIARACVHVIGPGRLDGVMANTQSAGIELQQFVNRRARIGTEREVVAGPHRCGRDLAAF